MNIKKIVFLGSFVAISCASIAVWAGRTYDDEYFYYDDANHSNVVGHKEYFCDGSVSSSGIVTPYYDKTSIPCVAY